MHPQAQHLIEALSLLPHPEGGFYRETFRSELCLRGLPWLAPDEARSASTAIYFMLPAGTFSAFHRVQADEVWHHYDGDAVDLYLLDASSGERIVRLGRQLSAGERPQVVVPAGVYQAARPVGEAYALCGCTVAPGFDFADFELPPRNQLIQAFPSHRGVIESLTRG